MSENIESNPPAPGPQPGESIKDYASRRLAQLKNSEQNFTDRVNATRNMLRQAENDLVACQARISEMQQIIKAESTDDPAKA